MSADEKVAEIRGLKIKKVLTSKKKLEITFSGSIDELSAVGKTIDEAVREANKASMMELYTSISISVMPDSGETEDENDGGKKD
jgi:hypothetical protein